MKIRLYIILLVLFIFFGCISTENAYRVDRIIRYDGIYYHHYFARGRTFASQLRFYEDGTVIQISTHVIRDRQLELFDELFNRENENISRGNYIISGNNIYFEIINIDGIIIYQGRIYNDRLIFHIYSKINNYEEHDVEYLFRQM